MAHNSSKTTGGIIQALLPRSILAISKINPPDLQKITNAIYSMQANRLTTEEMAVIICKAYNKVSYPFNLNVVNYIARVHSDKGNLLSLINFIGL